MTSFTIETDRPWNPLTLGMREGLMQGALDSLPADATQSQIDGRIAQYIMGDLRKPKKLETVRGHFLAFWPLIAAMADTSPATFDEILLEYADRVSTLG